MAYKRFRNPETGEVFELQGTPGNWDWVLVERPISEAGAPLSVRMAVGPESRKAEDRLRTLQQYYPEARQTEGGMVFPSPETGALTYYNPPGLDPGDIAEQARLGAELLGGGLGGAAAAATGAGTLATPTAAALGAEAAGSLFDVGMEAFTPRVETRTPLEQASQGVLNIGSSLAGEHLLAPLGPAAARLVRGRSPTEQMGLRRLYEVEGIPMRGVPGAVSGSPALTQAEQTLAKIPTSASTMQQAQEPTYQAIQERIGSLAEAFGTPRAPDAMGREISESAAGMLKQFDERASRLTSEMSDAIGFERQVPIANVEALRDKFAGMIEESPATYGYLQRPLQEIQAFTEEAATRGGMPVGLINRRRSLIGEDLKQPQQSGYTTNQQGALREVYGALARDIEEAAAQAGPEARRALERQRRYIRQPKQARIGTKRPLEKDIQQLAAGQDQESYNRLMKAAQQGPDALRRARKGLDMGTWNDFRATVLEDMGRARAGSQGAEGDRFSVNTFLTNWNKLPGDSRRLLFGGKRYGEYARSVGKLTRIMESLKDAEKLKNFSNTGAFNMWQNLLTGGAGAAAVPGMMAGDIAGAVGAAGATFGVPYATAKLMTSPRFVDFLTKPLPKEPGAFMTALSRMTGRIMQEEADPQIQRDLLTFLSGYQEAVKANQQGQQ